MNQRMRLIVGGVVTAVILALVIFGLWAFTTPTNKPTTVPTIAISPEQQSLSAYNDGMNALSKNDTGTAIAAFKKAVKLNPKNADAQRALENASSSSNNNSSSGSSSNNNSSNSNNTSNKNTKTNPTPTSAWDKPIALQKLLPSSFSGYTVGGIEQGGKSDADVSANAIKKGTVTTIVWTVHDLGTSAKATAFVNTKVTKQLYPKNAAQVIVNDITGAYFGTDGSDFACVAYTRGRYVFEVILTSQTPASVQDLAVQAATAFPTQP